jgi:hypothetical protein
MCASYPPTKTKKVELQLVASHYTQVIYKLKRVDVTRDSIIAIADGAPIKTGDESVSYCLKCPRCGNMETIVDEVTLEPTP